VLDTINKESQVPYYHQLYGMMRDRIIAGDLSPGLPSVQSRS
jgi:DNA-binding transcriptional regulator YhcF (GntR family)